MTEEKWLATLSTTEPYNNIGLIKLRRNNENSEVMRVRLTKNSKLYDLTTLKVFFVTHFTGKDSLNVPVQKEATVINAKEGIVEFIFDQDCMQKVGRQEAYFEIYDYDKFLDATQNFTYEIISSSRNMKADFTPYIETWQEAEKMLNEGTAKVLTDKTNNLELEKADIKYVSEEFKTKADKIETDGSLEELKNGKMDKDYKIKSSDFSQELKEELSEGKIPVVGKDSIGTINLQNEAVDHSKSVVNMKQAWLFATTYDNLEVDTINRRLTIPQGYFVVANGITPISIPAQSLLYSTEESTSLRLCFSIKSKLVSIKIASEYKYDKDLLDLGPIRNTGSLADRVNLNCSYYTVNKKAQLPNYSISPEQIKGLAQLNIGIGGGDKPQFKKDNITITITFPKNYINLIDGTGRIIRNINTTSVDPVVINYNKELVWDVRENKMLLVGHNEERPIESIILFSNSYGNCQYGYLKPYFDNQILKDDLIKEFNNNSLTKQLKDSLNEKLYELSREEGSFKFAFQTDPHISSTNPYLYKFELLNQISMYGGVNLIVNGGDTTDGTYAVKQTLTELIQANTKINKGTDYAVLQGNHDTGFAYFYEKYKLPAPSKENSISASDFHNASLKHLENNFVFDENNKTGGYYFKDYDDSKIRCIFLNSSDCYILKGGIPQIDPMNVYFNEKQLTWLGNQALDFSDKSDKEEWGVIVFSHASFIANSYQVVNGDIAEGLLNAFTKGTAFSGEGKMLDQTFSVTKDFSTQGEMEVIAGFTGHLHCDGIKQFIFNKPFVFTNCALPKVNTTPPSWSIVPQNREIGTINAECIDLVTINRKEKKIKIIRFGAGDDREISY